MSIMISTVAGLIDIPRKSLPSSMFPYNLIIICFEVFPDLTIATFHGVSRNLIVHVFGLYFLIANDAEHLFICLFPVGSLF